MNDFLRLSLLGAPQIWIGNKSLNGFANQKARALLFYLAVTGASHRRDHLIALLWSAMPDVKPRQNLRAVLPEVRYLIGSHIRIERQTN